MFYALRRSRRGEPSTDGVRIGSEKLPLKLIELSVFAC